MNRKIGRALNERQKASREKKDALLAHFRHAANTSAASGQAPAAAEPVDLPPESKENEHALKSLKKRVTELERQLKQARQKCEVAAKEANAQKKEIASLRRERYELQQALEGEWGAGKRLQGEVASLSAMLQAKDEQLAALSESVLLEEIDSLKNENRRLINTNSELRQQLSRIQQENQSMKHRLETENTVQIRSLKGQISRLSNVNDNLRREISAFKGKAEELEARLQLLEEAEDIEMLIRVLESRLTKETVSQYDGLYSLLARVKAMKRPNRKKKHRIPENTRVIGILKRQDDQFVLMGLHDATYPISATQLPLVEDAPAAAVIDEKGAAQIVEIFESDKGTVDEGSLKTKKEKTRNIKRDVPFSLGGLKVLVVGSRNLAAYRDALEAAGAVAETHNPYEEDLKLLPHAVARAEAILVCASHVPHTVYELIDRSSPNVEVIHHDRVSVILARARFLAINLYRTE